ncbi:MAG: nucleotidyltransferase domain-containing protein, partial [Candidatus Thermoplasmatota archaeon]|nr:nucleotidyltransferase domain-containing protein [Candidatus Thermoplasmatota archaeon]
MKKISKSKKIPLLKEYFEKEPSVLLAFLFGSFSRGFEMAESDFDVAVYLRNEEKRDKIWGDVTDIVEKEVDLVCLN